MIVLNILRVSSIMYKYTIRGIFLFLSLLVNSPAQVNYSDHVLFVVHLFLVLCYFIHFFLLFKKTFFKASSGKEDSMPQVEFGVRFKLG